MVGWLVGWLTGWLVGWLVEKQRATVQFAWSHSILRTPFACHHKHDHRCQITGMVD